MTTIFDRTPKYPGLQGDLARVTSIEDRVLIRAVDTMAEEGVTIAMSPDQARALAAGLVVAANDAEGGAAELDRAIAAIKGVTPHDDPWTAEDFSDEGDPAPGIDRHIATILNAVVSGGLVRANEPALAGHGYSVGIRDAILGSMEKEASQ